MSSHYNLLHILPHAGGGVGSVLRALLKAETKEHSPYIHSIASLEYLNDATRNCCDTLKIKWADNLAVRPRTDMDELVNKADIVLLHWWNHPYMMRLLFEGLPPARLLIWSHVNGFYPPQSFISELFEVPEIFIFSSQSSCDAPTIQNLPKYLAPRLRTIRSCAGIPEKAFQQQTISGAFRAGYIGTVESVKMHPDFLSLCAAANLPTPCIVAGGPDSDQLRKQAEALGLADRFEILGQITDPVPVFQKLHAFAYPLTPKHYGTGEQVLIEAMAFGAVPVVLDNPPECHLVKHGETGLVAANPAEFSAALRLLMENPAERERLAANARRFVLEECGIEHTVKAFHDIFSEIIETPPKSRKLALPEIPGITTGSPCHLFLSSLNNPEYQKLFQERKEIPAGILKDFISPTRGTPFHYLKMLGKDPELEAVCRFITDLKEKM